MIRDCTSLFPTNRGSHRLQILLIFSAVLGKYAVVPRKNSVFKHPPWFPGTDVPAFTHSGFVSHICRNTTLLSAKCALLQGGVVLLFVSCHWPMFLGQDWVAFRRDPDPQLLDFPKVCESKLSWTGSWQKQRAVNSLAALLGKGVAVICGGQGLLWSTPGVLPPCYDWAGVAERVVVTTNWCHWPDVFSFLWSLGDHCWPAQCRATHGYPEKCWPLCVLVQPTESEGVHMCVDLCPFNKVSSGYILINHWLLVLQGQSVCDR